MRDDAAAILTTTLLEALEPNPKVRELGLLRPDPALEQAIGRRSHPRAELVLEDPSKLLGRSLAQRGSKLIERILEISSAGHRPAGAAQYGA